MSFINPRLYAQHINNVRHICECPRLWRPLQVNLMQYMKLSTSRDFRINTATLEAALQEQEQQQDDSQQVCVSSNTVHATSVGLVHPQ